MSRYCRKDKVELLGEKRCVALPEVDPKAIAEHEETVFSTSISPSELYQELVASYCAAAVVDLSPAQGEFCKACLASRTKIVAVCGTESHASRLELVLTDHILGELSREGSTYFRPESVAKEGEESKGGKGKDGAEEKSKKRRSIPTPRLAPRKKIVRQRKMLRKRKPEKMVRKTRRSRKTPAPSPRRSHAKPRKTTKRLTGSPLTCGERLGRLEQILLALNLGCESHTRFGFSALWPNSGTIRS